MKPDIYQTVTNAIIEAIEEGQTAEKFQLPWTGKLVMPTNAHTGKGVALKLTGRRFAAKRPFSRG